VHQAIHEPKMGTEAEVQQAESESESESESKLLAIQFYRQQTKSFPTEKFQTKNGSHIHRPAFNAFSIKTSQGDYKTLFDMTTVYPIGRLVFTQSTRCKWQWNAYISDGCFHIQNTQGRYLLKLHLNLILRLTLSSLTLWIPSW
jgi:hypothetical protein